MNFPALISLKPHILEKYKWFLLATIISWVIWGFVLYLVVDYKKAEYRGLNGQILQNNDITTSPKNKDLEIYLEKLGKLENCPITGIMDSGSLSYGKYCFKRSTLLAGIKELGLYKQAEPHELDNFLGDEWTQEQILLSWIEKDPKILEKQFYTSVIKKKLGLP